MANARVLGWIVRGTGALLLVGFGSVTILLMIGSLLSLGLVGPKAFAWMALLLMLLSGSLASVGWRMWRRIDETSVMNFAFVIAFLFARACYLVMRESTIALVPLLMATAVLLTTYYVAKPYLLRRLALIQ